jgi:hypothetical protein
MRSRGALLRDLADVAQRLSDDALHVLLTIAIRAWIGQSKYGCLDLRHDSRDFRHEAFEEACDASFYLAAKLLTAGRDGARRARRNRLAGTAPDIGTVLRRQRRREFLAPPSLAFNPRSIATRSATARRRHHG